MKKIFFLLILTLALVIAGGTAWADEVTGLTTFSSGTPAYADSVNANFQEIQDSVNDNDSRISVRESVSRTLPDGVSTSYYGRVAIPQSINTAASTTISIYVSGCAGQSVRIGYVAAEIEIGWNGLIALIPSYQNIAMADNIFIGFPLNRASWTVASTNFDTDSILALYAYRDGANAGDTCASDATLYGVKVDFPLTTGGFQSVWVSPANLQ